MLPILLIPPHCTNSKRPPIGLRARFLLLTLVLFAGLGSTMAQDGGADDIPPMQADETRIIMLDGEQPTRLTYEATAGDVITVSARSLEIDPDPPAISDMIIAVAAADGTQLAYNDDHATDRDDLAPTDALIERLVLPEAGTYTIRVDTYGGIFPGEVEVTLTAADLFEAEFTEDDDGTLTINARLPRGLRYRYTFEAAADTVITASAKDISLTLDPRLTLLDAEGNVIATNDDHGTDDLTLDLLDAKLSDITLPADGRYTLVVTDFLGRAGTFALRVAR